MAAVVAACAVLMCVCYGKIANTQIKQEKKRIRIRINRNKWMQSLSSQCGARMLLGAECHLRLPQSTLSIYHFERLHQLKFVGFVHKLLSHSILVVVNFMDAVALYHSGTSHGHHRRSRMHISHFDSFSVYFYLLLSHHTACCMRHIIDHHSPHSAFVFYSQNNNIFISLLRPSSQPPHHFLFIIFESNEFLCSHKHLTIKRTEALEAAVAADIAVTDEAFVAFDRSDEELPAPTAHLISKYSCDTPPTHTFHISEMDAMRKGHYSESPFRITWAMLHVAMKQRSVQFEQDNNKKVFVAIVRPTLQILRQIFRMLLNVPHKFSWQWQRQRTTFFYFHYLYSVVTVSFAERRHTAHTHSRGQVHANTNNKIIFTCFEFELCNELFSMKWRSGECPQ